MISKLTSRISPAAGACLLVVTLGLGLWVSTAHASPAPSSGRACPMESAKNVSYFPEGTSFTLKKFQTTYTYTCFHGLWDEVITSLMPPVFDGNNGVLERSQSSPSPLSGGGQVLQ